jgi:hypothetical protein
LLSQRKSWQNPKILISLLFTLGKDFFRILIDTLVYQNMRGCAVRGSYAFFSVAFHWDGIPEKSCRQSIESWNRRVWMEFFARCGFSAAGGLVARPSEPPPRVGVVKPDKRRRGEEICPRPSTHISSYFLAPGSI